jgi:hypothetical protein
MIRDADILRGRALLLPPVAENVRRGPPVQILFAQVDALRGQVRHLPQPYFAGPQDVARFQILTPENHACHGDTDPTASAPEAAGGIPPLPTGARAPCLPAIATQPRVPPGVHADCPCTREINDRLRVLHLSTSPSSHPGGCVGHSRGAQSLIPCENRLMNHKKRHGLPVPRKVDFLKLARGEG